MGHYCENEYCGSSRSYWVDGDEGRELLDGVESAKFYLEDHDPANCAIHGGDCRGVATMWWPWRVAAKGSRPIAMREIRRFHDRAEAERYASWLREDGRDVEVI